jgi:hypothetical protein
MGRSIYSICPIWVYWKKIYSSRRKMKTESNKSIPSRLIYLKILYPRPWFFLWRNYAHLRTWKSDCYLFHQIVDIKWMWRCIPRSLQIKPTQRIAKEWKKFLQVRTTRGHWNLRLHLKCSIPSLKLWTDHLQMIL